ncbi:GIY-YIG nuclease family protein [Clostridia bacterium]|nr:GIY-YIG nuclease family protein [Clostridia bacterium]
MPYVYMLRCQDGTLYTGWTMDIDKRVKVHNAGKGAKYTRSRLPVELVYYKFENDKIWAMKEEYRIKQLTRKEKMKLVATMPSPLCKE